MTLPLFLHHDIARRAVYPRQQRFRQNVKQSTKNANLSSGTPIFKKRILAQFVSQDFLK